MASRMQIPPAFRCAGIAAALLVGEMAAFALPGLSGCWPFLAFALVVAVLASYGWRGRIPLPVLFFCLGAVLAFRTDGRPRSRPIRSVVCARPLQSASFTTRLLAPWEDLGRALSRLSGVGLEWNRELAGLNRAILLGRKGEIPAARRRTFADAGTIHVFAISGLHVMVVAWMLDACLLRLGVGQGGRGLACLPPLWAYVLLTGAHPSAVRAALMASFHLLATACNRRPDMLVSWSLTALVVYGLYPERLFDLGCTFSFTVMLGIVCWMRATRRVDAVFGANSWQARLVHKLGVPVAAWAAGVPIAAHVFGHVTPGGLLANLVVVRLAGPLVKFGAGGLLAGLLCLPLAALLNNAAALFTWAMVQVSAGVAAIPFSSLEVRPWTHVQCAVWYLGCLAAIVLLGRTMSPRPQATGTWWR